MRAFALAVLLALPAACGKESEPAPPPPLPDAWGPAPKEGMANLRLLLREFGKPISGTASSAADFNVTLMSDPGGALVMKSFRPDGEGRFICEDLAPGTYTVEVRSARRDFPDWSRTDVILAAGSSPLLRVDLR